MPNFLDNLAEENSHLVKNDKIASYDVLLCKTFEPGELSTSHLKNAHFFERVDQSVDMHQNAESPDLWMIKGSKIVRTDSTEG